jgi:hypothetical protein
MVTRANIAAQDYKLTKKKGWSTLAARHTVPV